MPPASSRLICQLWTKAENTTQTAVKLITAWVECVTVAATAEARRRWVLMKGLFRRLELETAFLKRWISSARFAAIGAAIGL
jgi:hypothetical protein